MRIREHLTILSSLTLVVLVQPVYSQIQDKNLNDYDSDFFSIKYPSSWFVNFERGISDAPGASGVTLLNRIAMNQSNHLTTPSIIAVTVLPKTIFPIIVSNFNDSEFVNSFVNFSFSPQKLSEDGSELLTDNSTSLSGHYARSVSYISNSELGHTYNLMIISADRDNIYQIFYGAQVSKFQEELPEVKSIISSFEIKKPKISTIDSTTDIDGMKLPFAVYNSSKYGIKLLYPKNWDVQEELFEIVSFTTPSSNLTYFPEAMFSIGGTTYLQGRPHFERFSIEQFKDYVNESIGALSRFQLSTAKHQLLDVGRTTTGNGYSAFKLLYLINEINPFGSSSALQTKRLQIFIPHRNNLYILQYDAEPSKFSAFLPAINKMISSFEITNDKKNLNLYKEHIPQFQAAKEKMAKNNSRTFISDSRSMEPYLYPDDVLLVSNSTTFDDLSVGDVIVFKKPSDTSTTIIARIIDIQFDSQGGPIITTKGDANPSPIPGTDFPIKKDNYIGKVTSIVIHVQK